MFTEFATSAEALDRDNLSPAGCYPIGIDYGFSGVKGFAPDKTFCFPNCAVQIAEEDLAAVLDLSPDDIFLRNSDGLWAVGMKASEMISDENAMNYEAEMYGRNRYFSPAFRAVMMAGLGIALSPTARRQYHGEPIFVQTGLPPKYKTQDSPMLMETLSGNFDFELRAGKGPFRRFTFSIPQASIFIMDQPMGSLISSITRSDGTQQAPDLAILRASTLVFDPGFKTLDIFDISAGMVRESDTFDTLGMHEVFRRTVSDLRTRYGVDITIPGMQQAIRRGYVTSFDRHKMTSQNIAFDEMLCKYSDDVCAEAIQRLVAIYNYLQAHNYLIITGGTGDAWFDHISDYFKGMQSLRIIRANQYSPELSMVYANVRGYYLYLVTALSRRRS